MTTFLTFRVPILASIVPYKLVEMGRRALVVLRILHRSSMVLNVRLRIEYLRMGVWCLSRKWNESWRGRWSRCWRQNWRQNRGWGWGWAGLDLRLSRNLEWRIVGVNRGRERRNGGSQSNWC
jgi:hypothetical protein